jgi:oxygen-independent coproporphyrinogen-3 oxidase
MGYTVKPATDQIGFGITSIGDLCGAFAQNVKKLSTYYAAIDAGRFPIERGFVLSEDDRLRRHVITNLMCNLQVDRRDVERRFAVTFADYFAAELAELESGPAAHGFVDLGPDVIRVTPSGRLFVRNVCMTFDRYLRNKTDTQVFSRTV